MKIRNGFISNSSSSSFILIVPKGKKIKLEDMEKYLGGYTDALDDRLKGIMTFLLWELQYRRIDSEYDDIIRESDDYERVIDKYDFLGEDFKNKITPNKSVYEIELSDSSDYGLIKWEDIFDIRQKAGNIFKNHDVILEMNV